MCMVMNMKKTVLDDNASIYQKREPETEKQKWQNMDKEQRRRYFLDYYLFRLIVGAAVILTVLFLIWHFVRPRDETVLYVAVLDESLDERKVMELKETLKEFYQSDEERQKIIIDDSFYMRNDALEKLEIYLHSNQIDVIIADEDTWRELAAYGFLQNMDTLLAGEKTGEYEENYRYAAGYKESDEVSFEDRETGQGEALPYGVDLSASDCFADMKSYIEKPVFSIAEGAPNPEHAVGLLEVFMNQNGR